MVHPSVPHQDKGKYKRNVHVFGVDFLFMLWEIIIEVVKIRYEGYTIFVLMLLGHFIVLFNYLILLIII